MRLSPTLLSFLRPSDKEGGLTVLDYELGSHDRIRAITVRLAELPARRSSTTIIPAHGTVRRLRRPSTNGTEVLLDGVLSVLVAHEFVFTRLMRLADALGCAYSHSTFIRIKC